MPFVTQMHLSSNVFFPERHDIFKRDPLGLENRLEIFCAGDLKVDQDTGNSLEAISIQSSIALKIKNVVVVKSSRELSSFNESQRTPYD